MCGKSWRKGKRRAGRENKWEKIGEKRERGNGRGGEEIGIGRGKGKKGNIKEGRGVARFLSFLFE